MGRMTQGSGSQQLEAAAAQATIAPVQGAVAGQVVTPRMLTRQDVVALRDRATELSRQITSATERREKTREDMRSATGPDRAGLEQRLAVLDTRIVRLEQEIDQNSQQLASIPARMAAVAGRTPGAPGGPPQNFNRLVDSMVPIVIVFTIFVLTPIALSISRYFWKKGSLPRVAPATAENNQRLERMEQALDSIAIEVERVSEGQRFVTRLMAEGRPALVEGQRVEAPIPIAVGESAGVPRYERPMPSSSGPQVHRPRA